ncbi:MAG TPA: MGMT family protein [Arthrobacter sp.]|nr:MGMT family protein [Arthrobacter sp.]
MRDDYIEAVLETAALIPPGRVLAYGDIAELLGTAGPRQVGSVLSHYGSSIPWWRVIRANGEPPACHGGSALVHYEAEDTPLRRNSTGSAGYKVDMRNGRWQPSEQEFEAVEAIVRKMSEGYGEVVP